jgi:hypothetical protein
MRTVILLNETTEGLECKALCLESDFVQLIDADPNYPYQKTMDESLFRVLHPNAYNTLVQDDIVGCLGIWLEQFYQCQRDFNIDDDCIFADKFFITVVDQCTIKINFYLGCECFEASSLILHLVRCLKGTQIEIEVSEITMFQVICDN